MCIAALKLRLLLVCSDVYNGAVNMGFDGHM